MGWMRGLTVGTRSVCRLIGLDSDGRLKHRTIRFDSVVQMALARVWMLVVLAVNDACAR